jgi:nitrite reductase/ring-hydroxylating ferredoxin subunit
MVTPYKRNIVQRILGICATPKPKDGDCWSYADGKVTVDLAGAQELDEPGSSIRLEGRDCPVRILVVYGDDDSYHAYRNKCRHAGRRLDPVPGEGKIMCCSVSKSTYDYEGKIMAGPAKEPIQVYPIEVIDGKLIIDIG